MNNEQIKNMRMKKTWVVGIVLFLNGYFGFPCYCQAQEPKLLTFDEAYEHVLSNSHILKQAKLQINEKEADIKASAGLRVPRISVSGTAMQMSDRIHLDLTPVRDAITPLYGALGNYGDFSGVPYGSATLPDAQSTAAVRSQLLEGLDEINAVTWDQTIQKKQFASLSANMAWPVYAGGKINAANKAAKIYNEEAGLQKDQKEAELLTELVTRYFGLVLSKESEEVRQQVLEAMEKHLYDAKKLSEEGQIAHVEELHAEVAKADAERELLKAKRQSSILESSLQNTLTLSENDSIKPASKLFLLKQIEKVSFFIDLAKSHSPLLKQVNTKKKLAETGIKAEKSTYLPSVALMGTYDIANKDLSPYMPDWMVGVGLNWTLFDGASGYRKIQAARLKSEQVDEAGKKAEDDIETVVRKLHHELGMQVEQLESLDKSLAFAETYEESKDRAFHEGLSSSSDLVDARLLVARFEIERLQAMYQYDVALASLLQFCGTPGLFVTYQQRDDVIIGSGN